MKVAGAVMSTILPSPPLSAEAIDFLNMDYPVDCAPVEKLFEIKMTKLEDALKTYA